MRPDHRRKGQATVEYALVYAGVLLPVTFAIIFSAQLLWVWHSAVEIGRDAARYAATHCWEPGAENVRQHVRENLPLMVDQQQFRDGPAEIAIEYFSRDPESGQLAEFSCEGSGCSTDCVPDVVRVRVSNYEFRAFVTALGLPPVRIPEFQTTIPMESAGCNADEEGTVACSP